MRSTCFLILLMTVLAYSSYSLKFSQPQTLTHFITPSNIIQLRSKQLQAHNKYRALHKAPPLKMSSSLNRKAQNYSDFLSANRLFQHSRTPNIGENLFKMFGGSYTAAKATDSWYSEVNLYDFNNPGFSSGTGHFTQVVWAGSKHVGFGISTVNGQTTVVAMYSPPGNYLGQFAQNVFRK